MTKGLVTLFHGTFNRGVRRIEWEMLDDIGRGRGTGSDLVAFWSTAAFGYFLLIPVGLLAGVALGRTVPAWIPGIVLALPFVGGVYSLVVRRTVPDSERRYVPGRLYWMHDIGIIALSLIAGVALGRSLQADVGQ